MKDWFKINIKNWIKNNYRFILFAFVVWISAHLIFEQTGNLSNVVGVILFLISIRLFFGEEGITGLIKLAGIGFLVMIFYIIGKSWLLKETVKFFGYSFNIDSNQMLVFVTALYVFLTLLNLSANTKRFDMSRLSMVKLTQSDVISFKFANVGEYIVKNIKVKIKVKRISKNIKESIFAYLDSKIKKIEFEIPEIFPHESKDIDLTNKIMQLLSINKYSELDKEVAIDILVLFSYESDTGFETPQNIQGKYGFSITPYGILERNRDLQGIIWK